MVKTYLTKLNNFPLFFLFFLLIKMYPLTSQRQRDTSIFLLLGIWAQILWSDQDELGTGSGIWGCIINQSQFALSTPHSSQSWLLQTLFISLRPQEAILASRVHQNPSQLLSFSLNHTPLTCSMSHGNHVESGYVGFTDPLRCWSGLKNPNEGQKLNIMQQIQALSLMAAWQWGWESHMQRIHIITQHEGQF